MKTETKLNIATACIAVFALVAMGYDLVQLVREIERGMRPVEVEQSSTPNR